MLNKLIRLKTVIEMTGKSRSAIYADMKTGTFPHSISLGAKSVAWTEASVAKWIQEKIDASTLNKRHLKNKQASDPSDWRVRWNGLSKSEQELEIKQARMNGELHISEI